MNPTVSVASGGILAGILFIYGVSGLVDVDPGELAIPIKKLGENRGMQDYEYDTGTYWVEPFLYDIAKYNVKWHDEFFEALEAKTKDGQPVSVDVSLQVALKDDLVGYLHETVGKDYFDEKVRPVMRSAIRNKISTQESDMIYTAQGRQDVQDFIQTYLDERLTEFGIQTEVNLRDIAFQNGDFIATIERKAREAQNVQIQKRQAEAMVYTANKIAEEARGAKEARVQAAEAQKEELRLEGEGQKLRDEAIAAGNLALKKAEAEGQRLLVEAYAGNPETVASIEWARNVGNKIEIWGIPTGAPGTSSIVDLNSVIKEGFGGKKQ